MRAIWLVFAAMFLGALAGSPRVTTGVTHTQRGTAHAQDGTQPPVPPCLSPTHCPK